MATKHCNACDRELSLESFSKGKHQTDGLQTQCKACQKIYKAAWGQKNKARERERQRREYAADPERHLLRKKAWRDANPEKVKQITERYEASHPGSRAEASKRWSERNREKRRQITRNYYAKNAEKWAKWARDYRNSSPDRVLHCRISAQLRANLKSAKGGQSAFKLLGYSLQDLKLHLERQFTRGMSWDNFGKWHIDHILPLASFPPGSGTDAWVITNLRPLWAGENLRKRDTRTHLI